MSQLEFEKEKELEQNNQQFGGQLEFEDADENASKLNNEDVSIQNDIADDVNDDIVVPEEDSEEEGQLDLFGNVEGAPAKKKAASKTNNALPKAPAKNPTKLYGKDYTVCYAGHKIAVPEDGMTLEKIRVYLEDQQDFPELSKERTEMTADDKKLHIVPVVKGAKKG